MRLQDVEAKDGREYPLWVWTLASIEPETYGSTARHTTSLSPKAAFFMRQTIEAFGGEVPQSLARVNSDDYIGCEAMGVVIQDGTFEGRDGQDHPRYKVDRLFPVLENASSPKPIAPATPTQQSAPAPAAKPLAATEDDIPF
jgi:hypothetical protein